LWRRKDLWFRPEDVKKLLITQPEGVGPEQSITEKAINLLEEYLKTHSDATHEAMFKYLANALKPATLSKKAVKFRILPEARKRAGVAARGAGRPRAVKESSKTTP
jgi:hypothetical protein